MIRALLAIAALLWAGPVLASAPRPVVLIAADEFWFEHARAGAERAGLQTARFDPAAPAPAGADGVLLMLADDTLAGPALAQAVLAAVSGGKKLVIAGDLPKGLSAQDTQSLLAAAGVTMTAPALPFAYDLRAIVKDAARTERARRYDNLFPPLARFAPLGQADFWLLLERRGDAALRYPAVLITPQGGFAAPGTIAWRDPRNGQMQDRLDLAAYLAAGFGLKVPDAIPPSLPPVDETALAAARAGFESEPSAATGRALAALLDEAGDHGARATVLQSMARSGFATLSEHVEAARALAAAGARDAALTLMISARARYFTTFDEPHLLMALALALDTSRPDLARMLVQSWWPRRSKPGFASALGQIAQLSPEGAALAASLRAQADLNAAERALLETTPVQIAAAPARELEPSPEPAPRRLAAAERAEAANRPARAEALFLAAVAEAPGPAYRGAARAAFAQGDAARAIGHLRAALRHDPKDDATAYLLAVSLARLGDAEAAHAEFNRLAASGALRWRTLALARIGQTEAASALEPRALAAGPGRRAFLMALAGAYAAGGSAADAQRVAAALQ